MTIGIDARFYGPSGKGLGRYTQRLIENLQKIDTDNDYVIFLTDENWHDFQPHNPKFRKVRANCRWYTLYEQLRMPLLIWREKIDLMHFPHFNVAIFTPCRFIVTIHDLILYRFPTRRSSTLDPITYWFKQLCYKFVIAYAVTRSAKVIAVSDYTKNDILKYFRRVQPDKIAVTHEACDSVETGQLKLPDANLSRYGINKPYLLYIGNAYPHKNLEKLIDLHYALDKERPGRFQLVLVGKKDYFYSRLENYAEEKTCSFRKSEPADIVFFGFAPQAILADLYRNAVLYVFPSLLEGFGLPPLEAMRYDLPVAAANNSSCPEILGNAAIYFDPHDLADMLTKVKQGLDDNALRAVLIQNGREKIKQYSWVNCAKETLSIYKQCA